MPRQPQQKSGVMRARSGFAVADRVIKRGALIAGDDPLVKTHAAYLEPVEDRIEQATAAPGERRSLPIPDPGAAKTADDPATTADEK